MPINRRNFLKSTGLAFALYPFSNGTAAPFERIQKQVSEDWRERDVPTICSLCPSRCLMVGKTNGRRIISLTGNPKDTFTNGKICSRGYAAVNIVSDPDRLKYPLKRVGARGEGRWTRIGWGEAIDTISHNLEKVIKQHGPDSVGLFANGPSSKYIIELFQDLKIKNLANTSHELCSLNRNSALEATFGTNDPSSMTKKMRDAKCIVLFGSHFGENVQANVLKDFLAALAKDAKLIVIDPRTSVIAAKADYHLMIRPGTDTALLLGWIQYILDNGFYNKKFVENHTTGLNLLRKKAAEYPLEKVASMTDLPERDIKRCAEILASNAPDVVLYPSNFSGWYGNDTQRLRSLAILHSLISDSETFTPLFLGQNLQIKREDKRFEHLQPISNGYRSSSSVIREAGKGNVQFLGCWGQNPFQSIPNPYRTTAAFQKADFTFCCDVLPTETSLYADIILPEATFLERMDGVETWDDHHKKTLGIRYPVMPPGYESKDPYWIVKQLSSRLGVGKHFDYDTVEKRLDSELKRLKLNVARIKSLDGVVSIPKTRGFTQSQQLQFPTPSGKIELYSKKLLDNGQSPLPQYVATTLPPKGFTRLLSGRSPVHYGSACNNDWLNHEIPENELWLNDEVAQKTRIRDGERLFLENQDGIRSAQPVKIKVTPGIRVDCVFLAHGFGAASPFLSQGFNRGISDNSLMTRSHPDTVSGSRGIRVNFVRFVKNGEPLEIPQLDTPPPFIEEKTRWWFDSFGSYENGRNRKDYV